MEKYIINGGNNLKGELDIKGAKNAILPILAATVISGETSVISNVSMLRDVEVMIEILTSLGAKVDLEGDSLIVDSSTINSISLSEELVRKMRSSIILMGSLLARFQEVRISYPGGCEIGPRPIDLHLKSLREMGAIIEESHGYLHCKTIGLKGADIQLDFPSVGATENIMLAAITADGTTIIRNAAREPEIIDLQNYLNKIGGKVTGAGSNVIKIKGVELKSLNRCTHKIISDRIVAGTYMVGAAMTKGEIILNNIIVDHLQSIIVKLKEIGAYIYIYDDKKTIKIIGPKNIKSIEMLQTLPFPGFPTDMQAQFMSLLSIAEGTSIINETVFENRFKHGEELRRMGADVKVFGKVAIVKGIENLTGASVYAKDLRGGAALVLGGLAAKGRTEIKDIKHIQRGYDKFYDNLQKLGADIKCV